MEGCLSCGVVEIHSLGLCANCYQRILGSPKYLSDKKYKRAIDALKKYPLDHVEYSTPYDYAVKKEEAERIKKVLTELTPREQAVLKYRFGISEQQKTLGSVADIFGVTTERIRQVEAKALRKLRHVSKTRKIRPEL